MFHLLKIRKKWALKKAGSKRVSKTFATKSAGEKEAYKYAEKGNVIAVHSPTGFIERTIKPNKS